MFQAEMQHSEETIQLLSRVQYNRFCVMQKVSMFLMTAVMLCLGVFANLNSNASMLLLLGGCWMAVSFQMPARRKAERLIKLMNGTFPRSAFHFQKGSIAIHGEEKDWTVNYDEIYCVLEDVPYFYLFLNRQAGYMIPKSALHPSDAAAFRSFLEKQTGLQTERTSSLATINFRSLQIRRRNARIRKERKKIKS